MQTITLFELNSLVQDVIESTLDHSYWVEAEISELRVVGGNCYIDLIEKAPNGNTPIARARANCWRFTWERVKDDFEQATNSSLAPGMKVLLQVAATFHPAYGFSWNIKDIDPTFTMGDMARKRKEIIQRLTEMGILEWNKELALSPFARRIAVVSSGSAAGYGDFTNQLSSNDYGLSFSTTLFPSVMQGEAVEESVITALSKIYSRCEDFDAVVIIRGGGAVSDMSGFDSLRLAEAVARFPLPVITGIGHDRDECVLDIVSNTRVKTPTAAAAFLIDNLHATMQRIEEAQDAIVNSVRRRMQLEALRIQKLSASLPSQARLLLSREDARLTRCADSIAVAARQRLTAGGAAIDKLMIRIPAAAKAIVVNGSHRLQVINQRLYDLDPQRVLDRGYSMTIANGKVVRSAKSVTTGTLLTTRLSKGTITSEVK